MKQEYFVYQVSYFKPLLIRLGNFGIDTEKIIQKSEIRHFDLSSSQNYVPTMVAHELFSLLRRNSENDTLIVNSLNDFSLSELGSYGSYLTGFSTLNDAIAAFVKSNYVLQTNLQTNLKIHKNKAIFSFSFLDQNSRKCRIPEYILLTIVSQLFTVYGGHNWHPISIHIPDAALSGIKSLLPGVECPVQYNQPEYRFVFSKSLLEHETYTNPLNFCGVPKYKEKNIVEVIENVISSYKYGCIPSLKTLASHFNTSESSLKRILKSKEAKFSDILGHILQERAVCLLTTSTMNINLISEHLGYSDSPNFIRSFKKWTGLTPGEYRESMIFSH
ncbi:AraC family transcriptional regulator [Aquimarina sp. RZ0]|uniref:AraC family transcriptional regulator n=1 Tax=Aquimarina sp. RZ0 TaxID=2607730 RepID=UPI0011F14422|nr:AraC family transcriptional regulator [Aquimarina sp. RZ0]KAA1244452.1 AraC family transcriptional regulator [Aquimarina sp. RZ0]